jgi:uncharacterized membrane protein HdeD (DUF308 family)
MKDQIQDGNHKINKTSVVCLVSGTIALAPYLAWIFAYLLSSNNITETIGFTLVATMAVEFFLPLFITGIVFGLTSLITGSIAIIQIKKRRETETSYRLAIIGIVLGILGAIANVIFAYLFFLAMID